MFNYDSCKCRQCDFQIPFERDEVIQRTVDHSKEFGHTLTLTRIGSNRDFYLDIVNGETIHGFPKYANRIQILWQKIAVFFRLGISYRNTKKL